MNEAANEALRWRALHCFLSDTGGLEQFLLDVAAPELERLLGDQLLQRWFYIRYAEGGHHLRLRVAELDDAEYAQLAERIQASLQNFVATPRDGASAELPAWMRSQYGEASVIEFPYEAEVQRYGGPHAISIAEKLFFVSSRLATEVLRKIGSGMPAKLAVAADLMSASAAALELSPDEAIDFFNTYAHYWERYLRLSDVTALHQDAATMERFKARYAAFREALDSGMPPKNLSQIWLHAMHDMIAACRSLADDGLLVSPETGQPPLTPGQLAMAITLIVTSQMHMLNNRLGVLPVQECQLGRMLARALGNAAGTTAAAAPLTSRST